MRVSVPGKIVLLGEYAVLEGAPAMVAAVSVRGEGVRTASAGAESPVVQAVRARAQAEGPVFEGGVSIDTERFRGPGRNKLGLGSSAATAVATAALLLGRKDEVCYRVALEGHRAAAKGKGSGIDVCASFHGGVLECEHQPGRMAPMSSGLDGLHMGVFHLGPSARTSSFIRSCRAAPGWSRWVRQLGDLAEGGIAAHRVGDLQRFLALVARFGWTMEGLGEDAGVPVVTEACRQLMRHAEELGGAAKPAGAGGGDVAVAWLRRPEDLDRLAERSGLRRLELSVEPQGVRFESGEA